MPEAWQFLNRRTATGASRVKGKQDRRAVNARAIAVSSGHRSGNASTGAEVLV